MTKRPKTKMIEQQGINYVASAVNSGNGIFNVIDTGNDIGIDAYIEFTQGEAATGCCIGAQIKSGSSYFKSKGNYWVIQTDKDHLNYWNSHLLPVVLIVFDPKVKMAYWCDVTEFLRNNKSVLTSSPFQIKVPKSNLFSESSIDSFMSHFLIYSSSKSTDNDLISSLNCLLADNVKYETKLSAIKSLFYYHRNSRATWFYFVNLVRFAEDFKLLRALIFFLRHVAYHGDIWWSEDNMVKPDVQCYAELLISKLFGEKEIEKLLRFVEDDGFDRGTFGQNIAALIARVDNRQEFLKKISLNSNISSETRFWALILAGYDMQHFDSVHEAISLFEEYLKKFPQDAYDYPIEEYLEYLHADGYSIM